MSERVIGIRRFVDGSQRVVYQEPDGRQFVLDDDLEPVYGVWILQDEELHDEPIIVAK
jgi:hypothetical protein